MNRPASRLSEKFLLFLFVLALAAGALLLFKRFVGEAPRQTVPADYPDQFRVRERAISKSSARSSISVRYPEILDLENPPARTAINKSIEDMAKAIVETYEDAAGQVSAVSSESAESTLTVSYKLSPPQEHYVSLLFSVSEYIAFSAHPNIYVRTGTFDLRTGRNVPLADLLADGSSFKKLSDLARTKLSAKNEIPADWAKEGASPDDGNYRNFTLEKLGMIISFNPYQVGPGALGIVTVPLTWAELSGIISLK